MRGWVLQDSEIDALDLSDELKDFAREMAAESSVGLTDDRERILLTAASEIERYIGKMIFGGVGGAPRVATSVVEVESPFTVPAVGALPKVDRRDRHRRRNSGLTRPRRLRRPPTSAVRLAGFAYRQRARIGSS